MYLSRLTTYGFKSFAQKLDMMFQHGITCVVGPNGCGKSNVVDALRWALGEQRPRALRSGSMGDVIFSGSGTRKPLGMAEVSVTIDNSRKILPIEFTEVTVTRRLFRSGESDYLLNKIPCRLKDIQDLLMDTGLGAQSYAIEQGMVDEIISDNTEERRRLFEEAAGVTRYKVRRRSAWNKLQSIQIDLQRIDDIIFEVERQVKLLGRQYRTAQRYNVLVNQLSDLQVHLARYQYFEMADRGRPMLEEIGFRKEDVEIGLTEITKLEANLEEIRTSLSEQDQALFASNAEVSRQIDEVNQKDRKILVSQEEVKSIEGFLIRASRQREELKIRGEAASRGQERTEHDIKEITLALQQTKTLFEREASSLEMITEDLDSRRIQTDDQKAGLIELLSEINEHGGWLERRRAELEGFDQRRDRLEEDLNRVEARCKEAETDASSAGIKIENLEQKLEKQTQLRSSHFESRKVLEEEQNRLVEAQNIVRARQEANGARLALLKKLREGFEGYSRGVQALTIDSPFSDRIRGIIADCIEVDLQYSAAMEAALGRALDCLVVDSVSDALDAISYLRSGSFGAAAFLPKECISAGPELAWTIPSEKGVVARGSDLLRGSQDLNEVMRRLLHRTLVVKDVQVALLVGPQMRAIGVNVVTLNGEVFSTDGMVYGGGSVGEETGLIGRVQQMEILQIGLSDGQTHLAELERKIGESNRKISEKTLLLELEDKSLGDLRNKLAVVLRDQQNAKEEKERQSVAARTLSEEATNLEIRKTTLQISTNEGEERLKIMEVKRYSMDSSVLEMDGNLRKLELQQRSQQDIVVSQRVEIASLKERSEYLLGEVVRFEQEQKEVGRAMIQLSEECSTGETRKRDLGVQVESASEELKQLHQLQTEVEQRRDQQAERQQELVITARGIEEKIKVKGKKINENRERLHAMDVEIAEMKTRSEELKERLKRDNGVDIETLGKLKDPEFVADIANAKIIEIQDQLRRIGSVNLAALDEYQVQKERFEFLTQQRNDLLEAEATLKRTINRVDRMARARFLQAFEKIQENFRMTFAQFFEGGEADLTMPSDEDPLESPLQITARPRGKQLQNINLLSGGEKALTAIALLFAIYLLKPSPFCILDEVDAPLDDANVDRFVRVVKEFSKDSQFIVVTHNKQTMAAADCLHGVTMEEPGVSKLVSVQIGNTEGGNGRMSEEELAGEVPVND